jgi:hypothetical protein
MATTKDNSTQLREPGEDNTENVFDPLTSANPTDKEYSKYNADIRTDIPGQIPDIPEPEQDRIIVDFTQESMDHTPFEDNTFGQGSGEGNHIDNDSEHSSESKVDFTQNEKFLMATVLTGISMEGLTVLNDFIINKWMITEEQVRNRILEGEVDPGLLEFQIDLGGGLLINVKEFLSKNKDEVEKSFKFTKDEQKRFTELLALILKDNNAQLKPEWMLVAMLLQKYGIGMYNMYKINADTKSLLDRVNYLIQVNREKHNIPGTPGVTFEKKDEKPPVDNKKSTNPPKSTKAKVKNTKKGPITAKISEEQGNDDKASRPVGNLREAGEGTGSRRAKRKISKESMGNLVQDVDFTEVKS